MNNSEIIACNIPVVEFLASGASSAGGRASPAVSTALAVLGNSRALRRGRDGGNDGGLSGSRDSGSRDSGGRDGGSGGSTSSSGGRDSTTVVDHGGSSGSVLDGVAAREGSEGLALDTLVDDGLHLASVHVGVGLLGELPARVGETESVEAVVHGLLESITLPTEDVVTVLSIPGGVAHGEDEGLRAVGRPHAVELLGGPGGLEEEEGHADGVGGWAVSVHENNTSIGVDTSLEEGHVALRVHRD